MRAPLAAAVAALLLLAAVPASGEEDPLTLVVNPLSKGLEGWDRAGPEKAFAFAASGEVLAIRGQSGKEVPRVVYRKAAWDRGDLKFEVKRGARKVRALLQPEPPGKPVSLEFPRDAVKTSDWTVLTVRVGGGKARMLSIDDEGKETEHGAVDLAEGTRVRFGFEAPTGTDASVTGVRLVRTYEDAPPFAEEGFESIFDGKTMEGFQVRDDIAPNIEVARGLIQADTRTRDMGMFWYAARRFKSYELRLRVLWPSNCLQLRPVEAVDKNGQFRKIDTTELNLSDYLDQESDADVVIKVADGKCTASVNGKQVFDEKTGNYDVTPIGFLVPRGKKTFLRDLRIKDLAPGESRLPGEGPEEGGGR